jgi:glycosidase
VIFRLPYDMRFALSLAFASFLGLAAGCRPASPQPGTSAWTERPAIYEVFVRDFSPEGNLGGVRAGLDRIEATGANVIWLMPIYPIGQINRKGTIGSPYAATDFRGINPDFGTAADLHQLIDAAHARGMKMILDFVPDHTAWDHAWTREHPERYIHDARGKISVPVDPSGRPTGWTDTAGLNYKNADTRQAVASDMRYWIDQFGVDGFRMDVAEFVPDDFWRAAIAQLRSIKPILMLAEAGAPKMHADGFDLTYGWDSYGGLKDVWKGKSAAAWTAHQVEDVASLPNNGRRLRFTTNHDETVSGPPVTLFGGPIGARAAFVSVAFLPGVPLLYNGEEVESPQKLTLFEKEPVVWDQPAARDASAFYAKVIHLERTHPAFSGRDITSLSTNEPDDVISYRRGNVVVLANTRPYPLNVSLNGASLKGARELLSDNEESADAVALGGFAAKVLELKP